jgi:alpha-beta hydrolase superfamily lysophospholipase
MLPNVDSPSLPPARARRWGRFFLRVAIWLVAVIVVLFGVVTFLQARAMTHYQPATARSTRLAELSGWDKTKIVLFGPTVRRQSNTRTPADVGLTYETVRFRGWAGLQIEAWRIPGRRGMPAVLMFPGYGASKDTLLRAANEFAALGCELWLVDPHGIGGSEGSVTSVGYYEAEDVAAAAREVRRLSPGQHQVLYGTSMGAVAILGAIHRGLVQPEALVLECPFDRFTNTIGNRFARIGLPRYPFAPAVAFWVGVQQGFNGLAHNPVAYAASVRCPTLLLQGGRDESVGPQFAGEVSRALGEHCHTELIPDAGHAYLVLYSADVWRRSVKSFLASTFVTR